MGVVRRLHYFSGFEKTVACGRFAFFIDLFNHLSSPIEFLESKRSLPIVALSTHFYKIVRFFSFQPRDGRVKKLPATLFKEKIIFLKKNPKKSRIFFEEKKFPSFFGFTSVRR